MTFDDWVKNKTSDKYNSKQNFSKQTSKYFYNKSLFEFKKSERFFCTNCSLLLFNEQEVDCHQNHEIMSNISRKEFKNPTKLLSSLSDNKFEAQFLF
jgi:hypothetical protein